MFKDYTFPDWAAVLAGASFLIALAIFVTIVIRALRMSRHEVNRLSHLPLDDKPDTTTKPDKP